MQIKWAWIAVRRREGVCVSVCVVVAITVMPMSHAYRLSLKISGKM